MPGTIHVSVLELVGLPAQPQSSSSISVKVSMGKQAHEIRDKEGTFIQLASLRDNLNVSIHDSQGNEIAHTDVETRSIVEKGTWDDLFPLKGGGKIRLKLQFYLTKDEQNRIRSMRDSAARKKKEDRPKSSHSSSGLAGASGGSSSSLQDLLKSRERSVDPAYSEAIDLSTESNVKALHKAQPDQKKQVFSTSKSTGALDNMPAYHQLKEKMHREQQTQLSRTLSNARKMILALESSPLKDFQKEALATDKSISTTQTSRSTEDLSSEVPSLKKTVTPNLKPIFSKSETALAPSLPEQIENERSNHFPGNDNLKEAAMLTSTEVDSPSKPQNIKETNFISTKPVLSRCKPAPSSIQEEVRKDRGGVLPVIGETKETKQLSSTSQVETPALVPSLEKKHPSNNEPGLSKYNTIPSPSSPDEIGEEIGKVLPGTFETRETIQSSISSPKEDEESHTLVEAERRKFSLKTLLASLPSNKKVLTNEFDKKQSINAHDLVLIEKKWRSKHWRSYQHIAEPKVLRGYEHYLIGSFRDWIFLEGIMYPCFLTDKKPFVEALDGCISDSSPQPDDQEQLKDVSATHGKSKKGLNGSKKAESTRRLNIPFSAPAGQVMKIAIVVGFGLLVILTRRRK